MSDEIKTEYQDPVNVEKQLRFEDVFGHFRTITAVPTDTPINGQSQIRVYKSGSDIRLYFYDTANNAWNYIPFISVPATLTDPNADRLVFWDDSDGKITYLTAGSGLSISGTTITASADVSGYFGNGADGNVTISGTTTLTSDKYYNNLTVNSTLDCGGYKIFAKGTISGTGTITSSGNAGGNGGNGNDAVGNAQGTGGSGGTAGSARTTGTLWGGNAGIVGGAGGQGAGAGVGSNGTAGGNGSAKTGTINGNGGNGATGGAGGNASGGNGGAGGGAGTGGTGTAINARPNDPFTASTMTAMIADAIYQMKNTAGNAGSGGGGGGGAANAFQGAGAGGGGAGGGGSDAGNMCVFANAIDTSSGLTFTAVGGNGGNGGNGGTCTGSPNDGGGGGGGGGGLGGRGGIVAIVYHTLTGNLSPNVSAGGNGTRGVGGSGPGTGDNGSDGNTPVASQAGEAYLIQI